MKLIPVREAVGHVLCHDMTQIIPAVSKGPRFKKGHVVQPEDIEVLLGMGKENLYVWEKREGMLHENEAAERLRDLCLSANISASAPSEGKIELRADSDGLFLVDEKRLCAVNSLDDVMIATRRSGAVKKGAKLAGTRVIPLVIDKARLAEAERAAGAEPLLRLLPFNLKTAGIVTTGSEVYSGRIEDSFTPVIEKKLSDYGIAVTQHAVVDDGLENIRAAILDMLESKVDIILCSGGMSVDPDDRTPGAIRAAGARIVSYGAPVLPGAMFLVGYFGKTPVLGLPGCVMYAKRTAFDLLLPYAAAGVKITREQISALGCGGLCLGCEDCRWPVCPFGK